MGEPERTCVGCGLKGPQSTQVRFVSGGNGDLVASRTAPGRGAWLCRSSAEVCFETAMKRNAFARTLREPVTKTTWLEDFLTLGS